MQLSRFAIIFALILAPFTANATSFTFGGTKFTNISFESNMSVEDILGTSHQLTGQISWDGKSGSFKFAVPVASLKTGIDKRDGHLRSKMWLNAAAHPHISFSGSKMVKTGPDTYNVTGDIELRGKKKTVTITVKAKMIAPKLTKMFKLGSGQGVKVTSSFELKLSDFGVMIPKMIAAKVNDIWKIRISIFGAESKK